MKTNDKPQSEAPSVEQLLDYLVQGVQEISRLPKVDIADHEGIKKSIEHYYSERAKWIEFTAAKINRLIGQSREELLNSIKQDLPKGEVNSMYHDLYSGHSKEWTQGFRTGYDICRNYTIATLEKVATPPVVSNNLSKGELKGKS